MSWELQRQSLAALIDSWAEGTIDARLAQQREMENIHQTSSGVPEIFLFLLFPSVAMSFRYILNMHEVTCIDHVWLNVGL